MLVVVRFLRIPYNLLQPSSPTPQPKYPFSNNMDGMCKGRPIITKPKTKREKRYRKTRFRNITKQFFIIGIPHVQNNNVYRDCYFIYYKNIPPFSTPPFFKSKDHSRKATNNTTQKDKESIPTPLKHCGTTLVSSSSQTLLTFHPFKTLHKTF